MSEQNAVTGQDVMTQAAFARLRGVSRSTISEYKTKNYLVMTEDGLVDVVASTEKLKTHLDPIRGGNRSSTATKASPKNTAYLDAKTREMEAKASKQELDTSARAGELVERDKASRVAFTLSRNAQEAMMAIPDRLSPLLAAEMDGAKVYDMLSDEIRRVCQALAKGAKEYFE